MTDQKDCLSEPEECKHESDCKICGEDWYCGNHGECIQQSTEGSTTRYFFTPAKLDAQDKVLPAELEHKIRSLLDCKTFILKLQADPKQINNINWILLNRQFDPAGFSEIERDPDREEKFKALGWNYADEPLICTLTSKKVATEGCKTFYNKCRWLHWLQKELRNFDPDNFDPDAGDLFSVERLLNRWPNNKSLALVTVMQEGSFLSDASEELQADRDVVMAAVKNRGVALQWASEALRGDKEVVMAAVQNEGNALEWATENLRDDREVVTAAISSHYCARCFFWASAALKANREMVLAAIEHYGGNLRFASEELRANREVVLAAVKKNGLVLWSASDELRNDRDVVSEAVQQNGLALLYASAPLQADIEIIEAALGQNGLALQYVSFADGGKLWLGKIYPPVPMVQRYALEEKAILQDPMALKYVPYPDRYKLAPIAFVMQPDVYVYKALNSTMQGRMLANFMKDDADLILSAIKNGKIRAINLASARLRNDPEFMKKVDKLKNIPQVSEWTDNNNVLFERTPTPRRATLYGPKSKYSTSQWHDKSSSMNGGEESKGEEDEPFNPELWSELPGDISIAIQSLADCEAVINSLTPSAVGELGRDWIKYNEQFNPPSWAEVRLYLENPDEVNRFQINNLVLDLTQVPKMCAFLPYSLWANAQETNDNVLLRTRWEELPQADKELWTNRAPIAACTEYYNKCKWLYWVNKNIESGNGRALMLLWPLLMPYVTSQTPSTPAEEQLKWDIADFSPRKQSAMHTPKFTEGTEIPEGTEEGKYRRAGGRSEAYYRFLKFKDRFKKRGSANVDLFKTKGIFVIQKNIMVVPPSKNSSDTLYYPIIIFQPLQQDLEEMTLTPIQILGQGSSGSIVEYKTQDDQRFAIKVENSIEESEETIINELDSYDCGQILARVIGEGPYGISRIKLNDVVLVTREFNNDPNSGRPKEGMKAKVLRIRIEDGAYLLEFEAGTVLKDAPVKKWAFGGEIISTEIPRIFAVKAMFSIMEYMEGDLDNPEIVNMFMQSHPSVKNRVDAVVMMVEEVRKQIVCLLEDSKGKYLYSDLKRVNILFKRNQDGQIIIKVGDLGSMVRNELDDGYVFSYPCLPYYKAFADPKTQQAKYACLAYEIGILMASLLGVDILPYWYQGLMDRLDEKKIEFREGDSQKILSVLRDSLYKKLKGSKYEYLVTLLNPEESRRNIRIPLTELELRVGAGGEDSKDEDLSQKRSEMMNPESDIYMSEPIPQAQAIYFDVKQQAYFINAWGSWAKKNKMTKEAQDYTNFAKLVPPNYGPNSLTYVPLLYLVADANYDLQEWKGVYTIDQWNDLIKVATDYSEWALKYSPRTLETLRLFLDNRRRLGFFDDPVNIEEERRKREEEESLAEAVKRSQRDAAEEERRKREDEKSQAEAVKRSQRVAAEERRKREDEKSQAEAVKRSQRVAAEERRKREDEKSQAEAVKRSQRVTAEERRKREDEKSQAEAVKRVAAEERRRLREETENVAAAQNDAKGCPSFGIKPKDCLGTTRDNIKKSYRDQSKQFHPDKNKGCDVDAKTKFQELTKKPCCKWYLDHGEDTTRDAPSTVQKCTSSCTTSSCTTSSCKHIAGSLEQCGCVRRVIRDSS